MLSSKHGLWRASSYTTLEADTAGVEENQSRSSARFCNGDSNMVNTIFVANGIETQQDGTTSLQLEEFLSNRLEIVKCWQDTAELSQSTAQHLPNLLESQHQTITTYIGRTGWYGAYHETQRKALSTTIHS